MVPVSVSLSLYIYIYKREIDRFTAMLAKSRYLLVKCVSQSEEPLSYLPTPPLRQDMTQGQFLSGV